MFPGCDQYSVPKYRMFWQVPFCLNVETVRKMDFISLLVMRWLMFSTRSKYNIISENLVNNLLDDLELHVMLLNDS